MKRISLTLSLLFIFTASSFAAGKTIASFQKKQYMIGPDIQFSPNAGRIAFTAHDGAKYYAPDYIYTGSTMNGSFKKAFTDPVITYVWSGENEIIFSSGTKDSVSVRSGNPEKGESRILFTKNLKMTGSGYSRNYEKYNIKAVSPSGEFMIVEKDKGLCVMVRISTGEETPLEGFTIPYSGNPASTLKFSGDSRKLILFDGKNSTYTLYNVSSSGLKLFKIIKSIRNITPGSNYIFNNDGTEIAFTQEKCKGGCYHITYTYDVENDKLLENITIKSGQILRVAFDNKFTKAVINNMHTKIKVFTLKKDGKEIK